MPLKKKSRNESYTFYGIEDGQKDGFKFNGERH